MSWKASAYVKALVVCPNGERLSKTEKLVALCLADSHQDKSETYTYPAMATLAEESLMDVRSCRRLLLALERKGVIEIVRPDRQGAGQLNFYRFPALDVLPAPRRKSAEEGGQNVRLFSAKRGTKGGQKGDTACNPPHPLFSEQKQEQKLNPPQPPSPPAVGASRRTGILPEADLKPHIDAVMQGCGWTNDRLRKSIAAQLRLMADRGRAAPTVALAIIAAWKSLCRNRHLLRHDWGPRKFIDEGHWKPDDEWPWDRRAVEQEQQARVGVGT